jgi:hypothetical protein
MSSDRSASVYCDDASFGLTDLNSSPLPGNWLPRSDKRFLQGRFRPKTDIGHCPKSSVLHMRSCFAAVILSPAWRKLLEKLYDLATLQLPADNHLADRINAMHLKD